MPRPELFQKLGMYVRRDFFGGAFCAQLRAEMRDGASDPARIVGDQSEERGSIREAVRRVSSVHITKPSKREVRSRLEDLRPELGNYFQVPLDGCDGPHFLSYGPDTFYKPHQDASPGAPPHILRRRVSLVVFLNSPAEGPAQEGYGGGELTFYGLLPGAEWEKCAFSLDASEGLLIAFRPSVLHEVKPVTFGQRFTIAAWLTDDTAL